MKTGLLSRIERLEEQAAKRRPAGPVHRVIVQIGESEPEAVKRYEAERQCSIGPGDFVVMRRIVAAPAAPTQ